ncbi:SdrD B-like domain-containing protein [Spirosoma arboris]|uniref:SdrD B-like domain-containing protein n=1 Tax=Spirosoma arboris TaxID=2682092 RepID=UPI0018DD50FA|nr:SdrD B-like domain-containing protein [Spirosoma arboris]
MGDIIITAYNANGVAVTSTSSSTLATSLGSYTLTVGNTNSYRVEFIIPGGLDYFNDGFHSNNGTGTSIQFVSGGNSGINFGISASLDYCQPVPPLIVPCYVSGDPLPDGSSIAATPVLVNIPYLAVGTGIAETTLATADAMGSVWGAAYQRETKKLFTAAFLKRHVGLGPAGLGGIYVTTATDTPTTSLYVDLENAPFNLDLGAAGLTGRTLPASGTTPSTDPLSFSLVGAAGLGGLALSSDGGTLYATDLFNRRLLALHISNPVSSSASLTASDLTFIALPDPGCTNSVARPFGLGVNNGKVYIGVVCTGENGGSASDLYAHIYAMDEGATTIPAAAIFSFRLNYSKGLIHTGDAGIGGNWEPWATQFSQMHTGILASAGIRIARPQPILSDISFADNGDMILGFTDRGGHQLGYKQRNTTDESDNPTLYSGYIGGDILRAHYNGSSWVLENNGTVGSLKSAGANNGQGPGTPTSTTYTAPSGEFYFEENYVTTHTETIMGSALSIPGINHTVVTMIDPFDVFTGGFGWFNNVTGVSDRRAQIYNSGTDNGITYGKTNGLGVIKALCNPAPIAIGNRVWLDTNNNGIQDPGETPLAGVKVTLSGPGITGSVSVTTNAVGEYYFSNSTSFSNTTGFVYSLTGLVSGGVYTLSFPVSVSAASLSSKPNSATGTNTNNIDTDPNAAGVISFTLGQSGENNFSYDAGFVPQPLTITANPDECNLATNHYNVAGSLALTNAIAGTATISDGSVTVVVPVSAGATSIPYALTGLISGTGSHTVTVSYNSQTASITYTAPLSCTVAPCGLSLIVTPSFCQSATNAYVLSGTITTTNVPLSGTLTIGSSAFTPRSLTLPAGNASGSFSYSGLVSNGQTYTVTASYSNSACSPVSYIYTAPGSCSVAPVCSIIASATAGQCAIATNTYSASVVVNLTNSTTGTLMVSLPGSAPISQTIAANTGSFTAVFAGLTSDGATHTATISLPGCGSATATFTAPGSCSVTPVCSLSATSTQSICQSATNTFTTVTVVTLTNPTTGILTVTDGPASLTFATIAGSSASFTATLANIVSNGANHTITASLPGCGTTTTTYTAPNSCSVAPVCSIIASATAGVCAIATNTYSATAVVQLTNPTAGTMTITDGPQSATFITTASSSATFAVAFTGLISDASTHIVTATLPGCSSTTTTYTAPTSCSIAPVCSLSAIVSAGICASATNLYSATAVVTVKNPATGGTVTVSTGNQTLTFSTTALSQNTFTAIFNGLVSDGVNHIVTVSLPGCGSINASYPAPTSCSVTPVCSLSAIAKPGICATSTNTSSTTVLVTMTNPTAGTLTVTDGARSVTFVVPASLGTTTAPAIFNGIPSDGASHVVTISLPGCSSTTLTYTAPGSCTEVSPLASLGDYVWYDTNGNGQQDAGETGVAGVTVKLFNPNSSTTTPIASLTTDSNGKYLFTSLSSGTYYVIFDKTTLPTGYTLTSTNLGSDATNSDADVVTGKTTYYTLASGEQKLTVDAGIVPPAPSLYLTKSVDKSKAKLGDTLTYTIILTNTGNSIAKNITLTDSATTGLTYLPNSTNSLTSATTTSWPIPTLQPGQSFTITAQARADSAGILYAKTTLPGQAAIVCTSIPFVMCAGDTYQFQLTAAPGRSSYKWFRDNQELIGQTTNVLQVTGPGTYSLAVDNVAGQCPDFSCCPFIIEEDTLLAFQAIAVPATCQGSVVQANGKLVLSGFRAGATYAYSLGSSFSEAASLSGGRQVIPVDGVLVSQLASPLVSQAYTIRVYSSSGCYTEQTVVLVASVCDCPAEVCVPYVISRTKNAPRISNSD